MPKKDPRVDAYIAKSAEFAKPILTHIRKIVHAACPDVQETMKWSMPFFDYKGTLCMMASFKEHATFGFWKSSLVIPAAERKNAANAMGAFGKLTKVGDLPSAKKLTAYVKTAAKLNDEGVKAPQFANRKKKPEVKPPAYITTALRKNAKALEHWKAFSPSHRREYVEWITGAKTEPTRDKRLATMLAQVAEGKSQNWKYERKK